MSADSAPAMLHPAALDARPAAGLSPRVATSSAAWASLALTCVTLAICYGVWYSYSVFLVAFLAEFGWSRSVLAGAFSVFTLVNGVWNPVVGWLADRWGPRRVVAAGGLVLAIGLAPTASSRIRGSSTRCSAW